MMKTVAELFKPRTIIAFSFYGVYLYMTFKTDLIPPKELSALVQMLMGFYFGQRVRKVTKTAG